MDNSRSTVARADIHERRREGLGGYDDRRDALSDYRTRPREHARVRQTIGHGTDRESYNRYIHCREQGPERRADLLIAPHLGHAPWAFATGCWSFDDQLCCTPQIPGVDPSLINLDDFSERIEDARRQPHEGWRRLSGRYDEVAFSCPALNLGRVTCC